MSDFDIVVVGGGGSGLAAAITAAEQGRRVVLLEKAPALGGSTGWSIGSVTAAGTPDQRAAGIDDSAAEHLADMPAWAGDLADRDNMALCRVLTDNAAASLAWLRESGLEFYGPLEEPPHRKPRMHTVLPNSRAFIYHLSRRARRAGVQVRTAVRAQRLIRDAAGRVIGVEAQDADGERAVFRAARGVILAGGDFNASDDYKAQFGAAAQIGLPAVNVHATGDCHRMACELGAVVVNGDIAFGQPRYRFAAPPGHPWWMKLPPVRPITSLMRWAMRRLPAALTRPFVLSFATTALAPEGALLSGGAALVNRDGAPVLDGRDSIGAAIARQPGALAYAVLDARLVARYSAWPHYVSTAPGVAYAYVQDYARNRPDICLRTASLDDAARRLGLPADRLAHSARAAGLGDGPYLILGPIHAYTVLADGGLKVSERLEVLDAEDRPIAGLYAAGSTAQGGMLLRGHGHHLAWAFSSGRLAGRHAAEQPAAS